MQQAQNQTSHPLARGFTIIEFLVVVGVIAILAITTVLVLNPVEMFKQTRDSQRLSDLQNLSKALYYTAFAGGYLGEATKVYVSIADSNVFCANLGLPALWIPPVGNAYYYSCKNVDVYQAVDGTGWVPANFADPFAINKKKMGLARYLAMFGALISKLPIDPVNSAETGNYYMYLYGGGEYEFVTKFESEKYQAKVTEDGGADDTRYETGTNLTFWGTAMGL